MATSSITKELIIHDLDRFLDAIEKSAKKQGIDLDAELEIMDDIVDRLKK